MSPYLLISVFLAGASAGLALAHLFILRPMARRFEKRLALVPRLSARPDVVGALADTAARLVENVGATRAGQRVATRWMLDDVSGLVRALSASRADGPQDPDTRARVIGMACAAVVHG